MGPRRLSLSPRPSHAEREPTVTHPPYRSFACPHHEYESEYEGHVHPLCPPPSPRGPRVLFIVLFLPGKSTSARRRRRRATRTRGRAQPPRRVSRALRGVVACWGADPFICRSRWAWAVLRGRAPARAAGVREGRLCGAQAVSAYGRDAGPPARGAPHSAFSFFRFSAFSRQQREVPLPVPVLTLRCTRPRPRPHRPPAPPLPPCAPGGVVRAAFSSPLRSYSSSNNGRGVRGGWAWGRVGTFFAGVLGGVGVGVWVCAA
ncbi:hypothetical protein B0H13DRAFT_1085649 [Mycena leptocephala]|nr:hypothetical protein B0H13DRAFT_1085649 [Mycena leptocephala]